MYARLRLQILGEGRNIRKCLYYKVVKDVQVQTLPYPDQLGEALLSNLAIMAIFDASSVSPSNITRNTHPMTKEMSSG
jgi:hypothetical protein